MPSSLCCLYKMDDFIRHLSGLCSGSAMFAKIQFMRRQSWMVYTHNLNVKYALITDIK